MNEFGRNENEFIKSMDQYNSFREEKSNSEIKSFEVSIGGFTYVYFNPPFPSKSKISEACYMESLYRKIVEE